MPAVAIKTPYGANVHRVVAVYGLKCDPEKDCALFVIRDKTEKVFLWKVIRPIFNEELNVWTFVIDISHVEAETIPKGSYKYGLTFYKDAIFEDIEESEVLPTDMLFTGDGEFIAEVEAVNGVEEPEEPEWPKELRKPIDGSVVVPITRKPYIVQEAVAREEGIL